MCVVLRWSWATAGFLLRGGGAGLDEMCMGGLGRGFFTLT